MNLRYMDGGGLWCGFLSPHPASESGFGSKGGERRERNRKCFYVRLYLKVKNVARF